MPDLAGAAAGRAPAMTLRPRHLLLAPLLLPAPGPAAAPPGLAAESRRPDLILLMCDSLRADHLGCYGYWRPTSPGLDQLAARGTLFEQCYSVRGFTGPAFASLFTGLTTRSHGVLDHGPNALPPEVPLLPELLREAGYRTVALFSNDVIERVGLDRRGWDEVELAPDERLIDRAVAILAEPAAAERPQPLFLWLHLYPPHSPYLPREPYLGEFDPDYRGPATGEREYLFSVTAGVESQSARDRARVVALYDANVRYVDTLLGAVLEAAAARRSALICFASDHGEELGDHSDYFFHAASVYRAAVHIPWIMSGLARLPAGRRVPRVVSQIDILPTLLELLGVPAPVGIDGESVARFIVAPDRPGGLAAGRQALPPIWWLRTAEWSYLYNPFALTPQGVACPQHGLFHRLSDPGEQLNLAAEPDRAAVLERLAATLERLRHGRTGIGAERLLAAESSPPSPAAGTFRVYRDPAEPSWVIVAWSPPPPGSGMGGPAVLLAYGSRPWRGLQGPGILEAPDRRALVARAGQSETGRTGSIAIQPAPWSLLSIECFWGETPAAGQIFVGAEAAVAPGHALRLDLGGSAAAP